MYDQIAHYYDLTHADLTADIPFVLEVAKVAGSPILELGCGSGRLLLPLARAGLMITGMDNSEGMLDLARKKLADETTAVQNRVILVQGDMTNFDLNGRFSLVIIPYNTFMHLDSRQALTTLKQVKKHLTADGRCLIDLANPFAVAATPEDNLLSLEGAITDPENGDIILHLGANQVDSANQILHITWIYDRSPAAGGTVQRTVAQADYHYRYPHQMELLLREAGFNQIDLYGDYERSPFSETSERLIILCQP